jgi:cobalamin biosynthesis protein CobT
MIEGTLAREYEAGLASTIRVLAEKYNVTVQFVGQAMEAKTSSNNVILPKLPDDTIISAADGEIISGFGLHEMGHQIMTDMKYGEEWFKKNSQRARYLANALEDVRLERAITEILPGTKQKIEATVNKVAEHTLSQIRPGDLKDINKIGPIAITWMGRKRLGYESEYLDKCLDALPKDIKDRINPWLDKLWDIPTGVKGLATVDQAVAYQGSRRVMEMASEFEKEEKKENKGKGGGAPAPGKGGAPGGTGAGPDGKGLPEQTLEQEILDTMDRGKGDDTEEGHEVIDPNLSSTVNQLVNKLTKGAVTGMGAFHGYRPFTTAWDTWNDRHMTNPWVPGGCLAFRRIKHSDGQAMYTDLSGKLRGTISVMRRKFERLVVSLNTADYEGGKRNGRLHTPRLSRVMVGHTDVFRHRVEGKRVNTAATLLVDLSGSMNGGVQDDHVIGLRVSKVKMAQLAAIALAETLENCGVAVEVLGFNATGTHDPSWSQAINAACAADANLRLKFDRFAPVDMHIFKAFDESVRQAQTALGNIARCVDGNNPDGESILYAADRLLKREEPKKILMVLSDGQPAYNHGHMTNVHQHTRDCVQWCIQQKIHTVGIGIMSDAVQQYYPKYVVLKSISELPGQVMEQISSLILGDRVILDNSKLLASNVQQAKAARPA